jgi:hypothetical protein
MLTIFAQDFPIPATPTKYYLSAAGALGPADSTILEVFVPCNV